MSAFPLTLPNALNPGSSHLRCGLDRHVHYEIAYLLSEYLREGMKMGAPRKGKHQMAEEIVGRLARQHSTAVVLFHHAVAERLGLGPSDHKCLDLLRDRGAMAGSDLSAITGLTSGAITGVVARLERAGYLRREPDPHDGRKQILRLAMKP